MPHMPHVWPGAGIGAESLALLVNFAKRLESMVC